MKRTGLFFLCLFISFVVSAQSKTIKSFEDLGAKITTWKGFERIDFKFENQDARLIIPKKAVNGNPWVWRARFPDWHTAADSIFESFAKGYYKSA